MKNLAFVLTGIILILFQFANAQPICGFDAVHQKRMATDSVYHAQVLQYENNIRQYIQAHPLPTKKSAKATNSIGGSSGTLSTALYTIPVVVHVVHTGGAVGTIYNPTDAQITGAIDYLNQVYNGSYPGTQGVGDLQIQFALAQRDPNCNPTNGINRVDGSSIPGYVSGGVNATTTLGTDEINVKNLIRWDPSQYYNVWVIDKIDGADGTSGQFIAGFAYFPGGDPNYDGIIMLATQMIAGQKTLPHEIGHAFNLYHPFQGSPDKNTCPAVTSGGCSVDGDQVCDTDPITYNQLGGIIDFTCRTGQTNSCTSTVYTINTESNYMNYTSCYTLFTAGQKTRMLASAGTTRLSLSQSPGATPPSQGATTCVPKVDFEITADQQTETTAATSGCRAYKDYTYNMVIGNTPSITATATLNVASGTATQGVDFDITTNGSFTSPSNVLTFPAGSMASQPFTVRIYDDASVESTESFTLGFTVNANGGNVVAGDGRPNLAINILDNDVAPTGGTGTGTGSIGTAAYTINASPFDATQQSSRIQFLYKASELTAAGIPAGTITGMSLDIYNKLSTRAFSSFNIKLGTTPAATTYLVNGSITLGSGMTVVKTLSSYNTVSGWNTFTFDTPFTWDGTSNLVVEICYDNGSTSATDAADQVLAYSDGGTGSQGNIFWQDGINCSQSFSSVGYYPNGIKPIAQFTYGIPATVVQTTLNSSQQQYLGANADIYFYDQTNNELMARIQNLSSFDYGCTQVVIDRAGTGSSQFWNTNPANYIMNKTFHVIPANNNPSGSYIITLYYTQAEVNGWQTATGQSISNIALIKTANQISLVTPANPTGAGTMITGAPTISSLGTNTALTYNFTTGFSGFGAGVVGTTLPVELISFDGHLQNNNAVLNWSTSSEINSRYFDIERSYDEKNFTKIGSVVAAGNSSIQHNYSFTDPDNAQAENYYRLKQINIDSSFEYSKIVLVSDDVNGNFKVLNNPFTNAIDLQLGTNVYGQVQTRLLDITGKELYRNSSVSAGSSAIHVDLSGKSLSAGVYVLEVWFNNQNHVQKVVKQ
ncbi:MAG: zinc-dependent metalloprotease [Bacteroidetes bacterium]|nr:zinc-dependent metalloprotease [Bacteroidota bacterium]